MPAPTLPASVAKAATEPPAGWWKFSEGSGYTLADSSPSANHGAIHGAKWTKGPGSASALAFQPGAWVDFPQPLRLTDAATLMLWVKFDQSARGGPKATGYPTLVSYGIDGDFSYNVALQAAKGRLGFSGSFTEPGGARILRGVQSIRDTWEAGAWHHFAIKCDPTERQMTTYVDGAMHDTAPFAAPIHPGNPNSRLYLGLPPGWRFGHVAPTGALSDVRIYKTALSAEEIAAAWRGRKTDQK